MSQIFTKLSIALILIAFLAGCAPASPTAVAPVYWPTNGWRTSTPEEQGMDSEYLLQMLEYIQKENLGLNSLLIVRNGYLVNELYIAPYSSTQPEYIFSVTKSVIGALVGIAIQKGYIKDVQQTISSLLPPELVAPLDESKKSITLENLLTMTSGLDCNENPQSGEPVMEDSENWVQFMLDQPMVAQPGSQFSYCTGAVQIVSAILQHATGMSAREFANLNLLLPLGIESLQEELWSSDPQGVTIGGYGLILTPADMAKLGHLFLNRGQWDGKSVVPADWVSTSTTGHANQEDKKEYGYLWWVDPQGKWYAALGRAGHHIFVYPDENLVVVFTATLPYTNDADLIPLELLLDQFILPSVKSSQPLEANPESLAKLDAGIRALAQPPRMDPPPLPAVALEISGKTFTIADNPGGWEKLIFTFQDGNPEAKVTINGIRVFTLGLDNNYRIFALNSSTFPEALLGKWEDQETFVAEDISLGLLSMIVYRIRFSGDTVSITVVDNYFGSQFEFQGTLEP